jgi:ABC-type microcin C transport system duplicated ATPase subunit YejF
VVLTEERKKEKAMSAYVSSSLLGLSKLIIVILFLFFNRNITWHDGLLTRQERIEKRGQKGFTVWLTGLSASGKSTIAEALERWLVERGIGAYRLDGQSFFFPHFVGGGK